VLRARKKALCRFAVFHFESPFFPLATLCLFVGVCTSLFSLLGGWLVSQFHSCHTICVLSFAGGCLTSTTARTAVATVAPLSFTVTSSIFLSNAHIRILSRLEIVIVIFSHELGSREASFPKLLQQHLLRLARFPRA